MRAYELDNLEAKFNSTLNANGRKFTKSKGLYDYVTKLTTTAPKYITKKVVKPVRIAAHFTVGGINSDIYTLTDSTITVPFVIARSGDVFQLSEPGKEVGFHLGKSNDNSYSNTTQSYQTIGLEISNFGPLTLKKGTDILVDAYGKDFCKLSDTQHYDKLEKPFRGYQYFAAYTDAQYDAIKLLIDDLCSTFGIPKKTVSEDKRFTYCPKEVFKDGIGIFAHCEIRKDKFDVAPNFDWSRVGL